MNKSRTRKLRSWIEIRHKEDERRKARERKEGIREEEGNKIKRRKNERK
jgi:hypothetical protein